MSQHWHGSTNAGFQYGFAPKFCGSGLRPRIRFAQSQHLEMWRVIGLGEPSHKEFLCKPFQY